MVLKSLILILQIDKNTNVIDRSLNIHESELFTFSVWITTVRFEGSGMKTTAFQNLLLNISYFLIMGKVGMKVSSNYWLSECIRSKVILRENVMILNNFMDFQNQFMKMDEEVYI